MTSAETPTPWVLVAGGFHRKGGMDRANLALAEYLIEQKIPVHIVAHFVDDCLAKHPLATVHYVPRPAGSYMLGQIPLELYGRRTARRVLNEWPRARVVVNGGNCVWPGINWVHYIHHAWQTPPPKSAPWPFRLKVALAAKLEKRNERSAFQCARLVITNSERTSREVVEFFGVEKKRVHTVYLGTDPDWVYVEPKERAASREALGIPESRVVAAFVGALGYDHRKGFDALFRAWKDLCLLPEWDVDLLVAGTGPALPMWQASVREAGLENRIRLLGFSDQVKRILAASDLLISPVRYEAYGLNVQEAICRGIPAMVSASAGVAEQYPPEFAPLLIPDPEDNDGLIERLLEWRPRRDEWKARFQPVSARLRSRTWRDTAADIVSIAYSSE